MSGRFYDRLIEEGVIAPSTAQGMAQPILTDLERAVVVKVDNVARWFYAGTDQENWIIARDFPVLLSPFEVAWYEWHHNGFVSSEVHGDHWEPAATMGFLVRVFEAQDYNKTFGKDLAEEYKRERDVDINPHWVQEILAFVDAGKGKPARGPLGGWRVPINGNGGSCVRGPEEAVYEMFPFAAFGRSPEIATRIEKGLLTSIYPTYMAISLMHCNNVKRITNEIPEPVQKKRRKKHRKPLAQYYTLEIDAFKDDVRAEGGAKSGGVKRAIHRRRGHFKEYTPERPLFGKHVGRWFWSERMLGTPELGEINKDYALKGQS